MLKYLKANAILTELLVCLRILEEKLDENGFGNLINLLDNAN